MDRKIFGTLSRWKHNPSRRPILLRGARQVGKTYAIREFGKEFPNCVEINFESMQQAGRLFNSDLDPHKILKHLELLLDASISPGETLLFLDEIQATPRAILSLRYFYEQLPELHVIAAGSLIDFELEKLGVPVGRIQFMHMYPMSFLEFVVATGNVSLAGAIADTGLQNPFAGPIHEKLLRLLAEYTAVGGMPEVVSCWVQSHDLKSCSEIHHTIIQAFQQDFHKYAKRHQLKYLSLLFDRIPACAGRRIKYAGVFEGYRKRDLEPCMNLLEKAKIATRIVHAAGNGIPLGSEAKPDRFKCLFLDVGLMQAILGVKTGQWILEPETSIVNSGPLMESFVGQELLAYSNPAIQPSLFYWHREKRSSNAELDYLIEWEGCVWPIEVKSGTSGSLKSIRAFFSSHPASKSGIRFSASNFSRLGNIIDYPLYAVSKLA